MVTQKEYEDFQNNHDRQHPLNPDGTPARPHPTQDDYTRFQEEHDRQHPLNPNGTPAYSHPTQDDYARFQEEHDRQHPLNPDGTPARPHPTQAEYTRFQNSFGQVSEPELRKVPYSMRPSRPQGTYTGIPMTEEEIAEEARLQDLAWKQFHDRDKSVKDLTLEEYAKVLEQREIQKQKEVEEKKLREKQQAAEKTKEEKGSAERVRQKKRIESNPLLKRLSENAYGGKEAQEMRREKLMMIKGKQSDL